MPFTNWYYIRPAAVSWQNLDGAYLSVQDTIEPGIAHMEHLDAPTGLQLVIEEGIRTGFAVRVLEHYGITPGFPRLLPETVPSGIGAVRYELELVACEPWLVDFDAWAANVSHGGADEA